jgi:hypothetical protein
MIQRNKTKNNTLSAHLARSWKQIFIQRQPKLYGCELQIREEFSLDPATINMELSLDLGSINNKLNGCSIRIIFSTDQNKGDVLTAPSEPLPTILSSCKM